MATPAKNTSVLDNIKSTTAGTLLATLIISLILAMLFAQVFDRSSDIIFVFIVLVAFAAAVGLTVRVLGDGGKAAMWIAALYGGAGAALLVDLGFNTGFDGSDPFGHVFLGSLGEGFFTVGTVVMASVAVIVATWGKK